MRILLLACSIPALTIAAAIAQTKTAPTPAPPPAKVAACDATEHDKSGFTECEALRISYFQSLEQPLKVQINSYEQQKMKFIESISQNYPGKEYEPASPDYPIGRIVDPAAEQAQHVNQRRPGTIPTGPQPYGAAHPTPPAKSPQVTPAPTLDPKP